MMTSRERVLTALNHQPADRVPIDLSGHRSSGIAAVAYAKLRNHLGLPKKPVRVYDPIQQLAVVDPDVLDLFGVDTIELGRGFALTDDCWKDWELPDGTPCQMPRWALPERDGQRWVIRSKSGRVIAEMPAGSLYFEQTYYPFFDGPPDHEQIEAAFAESMWTAIASPPGPLVAGPAGAETFSAGARQLRQQTDRAIIGLFGGNLLECGQFLYRNDGFFLLLAGEPDKADDFLEKLVTLHLRNLERFLRLVGPSIDVIVFGDDLGMQTGPQMSPAMYREFFKPRHARLWKRSKELAPHARIMLHCCGGVRELLPDLIEAGLEAINPVQITCHGMEAAQLKKDFGRDLTFWGGGCDTRQILPHGTPREITEHVRAQVKLLQPGGGFVFQQVHNILANVPPPNVVAMYDAVRTAVP